MPWSLLLNKNVLIAIAIALLIGGLAYAHSNYVDGLVDAAVTAERTKWQAAIDQQKAEAKAKLESIIAANAEKERADLEHALQLERTYATNIASIKSDLAAARKSGRLRDPGAVAGCGSGSGSAEAETKADPASASSQETGGQLSEQASEFLRVEASRADENTLIANTCLAFIHEGEPP